MKKVLIGAVQIAVILLFLVLVFLFSRAPNVEDIQSGEEGFTSSSDTLLAVTVVAPQTITSNLFVDSTGTVNTRNVVPLATQISGRVVWVSEALRTGGTFESNEELLRIDASDYELEEAQAKANLQAAKANLELREAESLAGEENWEIMHPGESVPTLVARIPQINQSKANIEVAEANLAIAQLRLSRTSYSLPFDGKVLASDVGVGQLLTQGQPFGSVYDAGSLEVQVDLSESEIRLLEPLEGRLAYVTRGSRKIDAMVARSSASVDIRTRTTTLYLSVDPSAPLLPGYFVDVRIFGRTATDTYRLPESVEQSNSSLWVVREGKLDRVEVEVVARDAGDIIVPAFDYGEGIVIGSPSSAYPGMPVAMAPDQS